MPNDRHTADRRRGGIRFRSPVVSRALGLGAATLLLGTLPGCQSITGTPVVSQVRVIDASPDAGGLDVYEGDGILAYNLGQGTVTSYIPSAPGTYTFIADAAGSRQTLSSQPANLPADQQTTVLIGNTLAGLQATVLRDQSQPAPAGQVSLRILDQATRAGALDLYLIPTGSTLLPTKPFATGVHFGHNSGYRNVPAGTYTLAAVPAGTVVTGSTISLYTGAAVPYGSGSARTLVLIDRPLGSASGLEVIVGNDFDPATQDESRPEKF